MVSNFILLLISWEFFLYFSMLGSFVTLVTYNLTNSLNHYKKLGYTNFPTRDNSTNVPWLFPLVLGECWHNNHHARPGSSHFGSVVSGKWWEFDPSGTFIKIFQDSPK
jgi:stearoyl-CoA desaturase (delta-9 desaturase)